MLSISLNQERFLMRIAFWHSTMALKVPLDMHTRTCCLIYAIILAGFLSTGFAQELDYELCDKALNTDSYAYENMLLSKGIDDWLFVAGDTKQYTVEDVAIPYLRRLNDTLRKREIYLVAVVVPPRGVLAYDYLDRSQLDDGYSRETAVRQYTSFIDKLRTTGIIAPNLIEVAIEGDVGQRFFFKRDNHWTPDGTRAVASALANQIVGFDGFSDLPRQEYETVITNSEAIQEGSFSKLLYELCGIQLPAEQFVRYKTEPKSQKTLDLFETESAPKIVVVGTSNSAQDRLNFVGFLKESLQTDVLNLSVSGGGQWTSMTDYFISEEFRNNRPSVVIWEFPVRSLDGFSVQSALRSIIPSIFGDCTGSEVLSNELKINDTSVQILDSIDKAVKGNSFYLSLEFSDLSVTSFSTLTTHADGSVDEVKINRSTRAVNNGLFFLEFADFIDSAVEGVSIEFSNPPSGNLRVRICQAIP